MTKKNGRPLKYDEQMTEAVKLRLTPAQKFSLQKLADELSNGSIADFIRAQFQDAFEDWREDYEAWKGEALRDG